MLKKIDHHMLYMSPRQDARRSTVPFRQNIEQSRGRGAGVYISSDANSKNELQLNSIQAHPYSKLSLKPLQDDQLSVSFKGFNINKVLAPVVEEIPGKLTMFVRSAIESLSTEQSTLYSQRVKRFIEAAKTDEGFKRYLGISDEVASKLTEYSLIKIPKRSLIERTFSVLVSPITIIKDFALWGIDNRFGKAVFPKIHDKIQKTKQYDAIIADYKGIVGISNFVRIQENNYRRYCCHSDWTPDDNLIIPKDILKQKLQNQKLRAVDPEKGQYSAKHLMLGNRLVSGSVYAGFLSNDAYNTTMRYSNDENASEEQRASRAKQEFAKIGMNMYIHNLLLSIFESQINKSMFHALLASGFTVGAAEVLGRMLVGRPIFPSNKENLDKMEEKMQNKKGVLAAVGRLIAGDKSATKSLIQKTKEENEAKNSLANPTFIQFDKMANTASFASNNSFRAKSPAFKGLVKPPKYLFERSRIKQMLDFIRDLDPVQYDAYAEIIKGALKRSGNFDGTRTLEEILNDPSVANIALGENHTLYSRFINGFFSPVTFIQETVTGLYQSGRKLIYGETPISEKELQRPDFREYLLKRLDDVAWKTSPLNIDEKEIKIYKEFLAQARTNKFEENGIKNLILTLEKRFNALGIDMNSREAQNLVNAKKEFNKIMMKADGANHTEYDGNSIAQLNINLSRAISTIFLITDSYNLTMQYSNDNKKEAVKTAKNRAAQEASRIASSAYIMAFTHKLISKVYNGSLLGAFATVLLTSTASDSLARAVVGVPIFRKTQEELIEIEEKQKETKNPIRKTLAYLIGKKVN